MRKPERALRRLGRLFLGKNTLRRLLKGKTDSLFPCGSAAVFCGSLKWREREEGRTCSGQFGAHRWNAFETVEMLAI